MIERCSRELEGRKQQKYVVIRYSRLMMDTPHGAQNPAYRHTIFFARCIGGHDKDGSLEVKGDEAMRR